MMVLISYDVCTMDSEGKKRLRKVSKECQNHAQRVQNSVFEVLLDAAQLAALKCELEKIIQPETDSIRIYRLGNSYQSKIETMGHSGPIQTGEPLLL